MWGRLGWLLVLRQRPEQIVRRQLARLRTALPLRGSRLV